jgi:hypothetical protein
MKRAGDPVSINPVIGFETGKPVGADLGSIQFARIRRPFGVPTRSWGDPRQRWQFAFGAWLTERPVRWLSSAPSATPPAQRKAFHERVLEEFPQERPLRRRGRRNLHWAKRKMSNWPLLRRHAHPPQSVVFNLASRIVV